MSWEQMEIAQKKEKKKVVIDLYTDWCGWCKRMDATTLQDAEVIEIVNRNFYAVKFNAEYKSDIIFNDKTYKFIPQGDRGYHELAAKIANGQLSYPTFVYLDETLSTIQAVAGYREARDFLMIASYFGGNYHKTTPWQVYMEKYIRNQK
jgi:thioredoxin-related protein